ncbi:type II toxin-antitoxin system RelE/ParE family toxin [Thalassobaculum sp.]|uniref:type II toxin-antitoxin system RelE/ParE family toxin n=1 Tax=Thalassobaculum sp. TaxID=2022740 RepID=UPI0032EB22B8
MPGVVVGVANSAIADLNALRSWYVEQGAPAAGNRLIAEIFTRIEVLHDFPEIGRIVPEFGRHGLRELIHPPFRIVYRCSSSQVWVIRVWRSEQQLKLPPDPSTR